VTCISSIGFDCCQIRVKGAKIQVQRRAKGFSLATRLHIPRHIQARPYYARFFVSVYTSISFCVEDAIPVTVERRHPLPFHLESSSNVIHDMLRRTRQHTVRTESVFCDTCTILFRPLSIAIYRSAGISSALDKRWDPARRISTHRRLGHLSSFQKFSLPRAAQRRRKAPCYPSPQLFLSPLVQYHRFSAGE
jgi:hypothetical protein